jgi:hypothetical protein
MFTNQSTVKSTYVVTSIYAITCINRSSFPCNLLTLSVPGEGHSRNACRGTKLDIYVFIVQSSMYLLRGNVLTEVQLTGQGNDDLLIQVIA